MLSARNPSSHGRAVGWLWVTLLLVNVVHGQSVIPRLRVALAQATTDTARARLLSNLGEYYQADRPDTALVLFEQSLRIAQRARDSVGLSRAYCWLAYIHMHRYVEEDRALMLARRAIAIAGPRNDHQHLAEGYLTLAWGAIHQRSNHAEELIQITLSHARQAAGSWQVMGRAYGTLAHVKLYQQNQPKLADSLMRKSMQTFEGRNTDYWFTATLDYCDLLIKQGRQKSLKLMLRRLTATKTRLKKTDGTFVYTNDVARLAIMTQNYAEAKTTLLKGIAHEHKRPKPDSLHLYFYYQTLVDVLTRQADYKQALLYDQKLVRIGLWIQHNYLSRKSRIQMAELKGTLTVQQKESEIEALHVQQRTYLWISGLVAALLIGFVVILQVGKRRIEQQRAELAHLNATKNKLFTMLSHDLLSPVALLANSLDLFDGGVLSREELGQRMPNLRGQLNNVHTVLENTLNWSMTQLEGMRPQRESVAVQPIIAEQIRLAQSIANRKHIQINESIPECSYLLVDKNHLIIVIRNLLQNALKFTTVGGTVSFTYAEADGMGQIAVDDTGPGMTTNQLNNLFSLNQQTGKGTQGETGTGLGLVIVRDLVLANQGVIDVQCHETKGTKVTVKFKVHQASRLANQPLGPRAVSEHPERD